MRRSKIVCTLGPASRSPQRIKELIQAGMDVARLNQSHGSQEDHLKTLQAVRHQSLSLDRAVAILFDLQGPKIRIGTFAPGEIELSPGEEFIITTDTSAVGDRHRVSTNYAQLTADVEPGVPILLDDGNLALETTAVRGNEVVTIVRTGGILKSRKGINLRGIAVSAPALTEKDRKDLAFGVRVGVDYIALSFVRSPQDVLEARQLATAGGVRVPIIAKIERPEALERLEDIIDAADGVMVARGDLGVELGPEKVPQIQKEIIERTNSKCKMVITATQMLESMITNKRPTRAEASDVANAVLDGTDALMLSGETAVGNHPVEAVQTMSRIISEIEASPHFRHTLKTPAPDFKVSANAIAQAAVIAARQMGIRTIACVTTSGGAARLMSEYRPEAQIIALTSDEITYRQLALYWGVRPLLIQPAVTTDEMLDRAEAVLQKYQLARSGEEVVITMAVPVGAGETTNMLKIHRMS